MASAMAAMLDELMGEWEPNSLCNLQGVLHLPCYQQAHLTSWLLAGKERNVPLNERSGKRLRFSDREVCKYDLAGLCPYGLFRNTKSDLGERVLQLLVCICASRL